MLSQENLVVQRKMTLNTHILWGLLVDGDSTSPKTNSKGGGQVFFSQSDVL